MDCPRSILTSLSNSLAENFGYLKCICFIKTSNVQTFQPIILYTEEKGVNSKFKKFYSINRIVLEKVFFAWIYIYLVSKCKLFQLIFSIQKVDPTEFGVGGSFVIKCVFLLFLCFFIIPLFSFIFSLINYNSYLSHRIIDSFPQILKWKIKIKTSFVCHKGYTWFFREPVIIQWILVGFEASF